MYVRPYLLNLYYLLLCTYFFVITLSIAVVNLSLTETILFTSCVTYKYGNQSESIQTILNRMLSVNAYGAIRLYHKNENIHRNE